MEDCEITSSNCNTNIWNVEYNILVKHTGYILCLARNDCQKLSLTNLKELEQQEASSASAQQL